MSEDGQCCGANTVPPAPDPGNSGPDAWTAKYDPDSEAEQERLLKILAGEGG
jgi:hypothetical protein